MAAGKALAAFLAVLLAPASARAQSVHADLKLIPAYFTGTFGTNIGTDITYLPLVLHVVSPRQDLSVTIPYLDIRTDQPVTYLGGEVITRGAGGRTASSGPGDVVIREDVYFTQGGPHRPWVWASARVKLPTADETKGLGTGEYDYGPGAGFYQPLSKRLFLLATVDYVIRGDPPGVDYRNTLWYSAGLHARLTSSSSLGAYLDDRDSVVSGRPDLRDASLTFSHKFAGQLGIELTAYEGLSDTAEDWGASLGFILRGERR